MNASRQSALKRRAGVPLVLLLTAVAALTPAAAQAATWTVGAPTVDSVSGAPWNPSQGVPSFDGNPVSSYPTSDLLPSFSFAGQSSSATVSNDVQTGSQTVTTASTTTTTPVTTTTPITEPNVAVYPAATPPAITTTTANTSTTTSLANSEPDVSGYVGTPGPLSGYCLSSETDAADDNESPYFPLGSLTPNVPQNETGGPLPFSPYYFPQVVQTPGSTSSQDLTGYFDWRPKDGDEAIVVADSTDGGLTWKFEGQALDQNGSYCPSADTNDDGQGHPYVADLGTGATSNTYLYTLQRAVGDYAGTNLLVDPVSPSASDPLASAPSVASVGVDPNTFATTATQLSSAMPANIPVSTLGGDQAYGNSTDSTISLPDISALPTGAAEYEDITAGSEANGDVTPPVVSCTGSDSLGGSTGQSPELTGCTSPAGITVGANDDLVEVIGTASAAYTIPVGPQTQAASSGLSKLVLTPTSANSDTLTYLLNNNAPNRYYIDGRTVYCTQGNADPTTTIEDCTATVTASDTSAVAVKVGDPVIADPIVPTATGGGPVQQTNGLISPDGIIGSLPSSANSAWGEPSGAGHVVLYTEKLVNYFIEGGINGTVTGPDAKAYSNFSKDGGGTKGFTTPQTGSSAALATGYVPAPGANALDYNISPFPTESERLPTSAEYPNQGSFQIYIGAQTASATGGPAGTGAALDTLTCTSWGVNTNIADLYNPNLNTIDLIGCTGGTGSTTTSGSGSSEEYYIGSDGFNAGHQGNWVAGPGAAIELANGSGKSVLQQIGEGKAITTGQAQKLFGNNEDYEVVRAAYTTDGLNFTDLGPVSGATSGAIAGAGTGASQTCPTGGAGSTSGAYTDISDPCQQDAPAGNPSTGGDAANANIDSSNPQGDAPTSLSAGTVDTTELRWPGARGTIVTNPDGTIGLFLSGAWASDGDSDAFNQTFYTESSNGGKTWSVPTVVLSTDYDFSASAQQDTALAAGNYPYLGVSAYYSGRAYDPTVVQNANGSLTLVFAGYRLPNPVKAAGSPIGTNASAQYAEGATLSSGPYSGEFETDPAIYRNILTTTLTQTPAALISEWRPVGPGGAASDYVDIANNGSSSLSLSGWTLKLVDAKGNVASVALSGTLAVNGHLLAADSGYAADTALSTVTPADITYNLGTAGVGTPVGVQVLNAAGDVVDAVGLTGAPAGFYEGTTLAAPGSYPSSGEFAWSRTYSNGALVNSENNASDFTFVSTTSAAQGEPGPLDEASPVVHNDILQSSLVDPNEPANSAPNFYYNPTTQTVDINRQLTNCSGQATTGVCVNANPGTTGMNVTRLQFRVTGLTTSVLLAENSTVNSVTDANGGWTLEPLTLQAPAGSTGGLNSVLVATTDLPPVAGSSPQTYSLPPGGYVDVDFRFAVQGTGSFTFAYNAEDDLEPASSGTTGQSASGSSTGPISPVTQSQPTGSAAAATPISSVTSGILSANGEASVTVTPVTADTKTHSKKKVTKKSKKRLKRKAKKHKAKTHGVKHKASHAGI